LGGGGSPAAFAGGGRSHRTPNMRANAVLLSAFLAVFVWSLIRPHDYFTWLLEVFPAIIGFVLVVAMRRRFPLTPLLMALLCLHAIILMVGGHYTYAQVPFGFWMQRALGLGRNDYDRIGHFAQGFVPAIVAREILIRRNVVRGRGWLFTIVVAICLAISAAYELLEWSVSILTGSKGDAFLGTQGDVWDTQKDMAMALAGAVAAPLILGPLHDRQLERVAAAKT
jgi:putative membrane protein